MGIDVGEAKIRAGQLRQYKVWLESARRMMNEYKNQINSSWSGVEVTSINTAICQVISSLDQTIHELDGISTDVVMVANEIRVEEVEAERQLKLQEASQQVSRIRSEISKLKEQKDEIEKFLQNGADPKLQAEWDQIVQQIQKAERDGSTWQSCLNSLRR